MKIYFGHPINTYNTELERMLVLRIQEVLECEVENPNQFHHSCGYHRKGMAYFLEDVIPKCKIGGVFLPFFNGSWGAGVFKEMVAVKNQHGLIFRVNHRGDIEHLSGVDLVRQNVLSVEETLARIALPYFDEGEQGTKSDAGGVCG